MNHHAWDDDTSFQQLIFTVFVDKKAEDLEIHFSTIK